MDINKEAKGIFILLQHGQLGLSLTAPFVSMNRPSLMMNVCYTMKPVHYGHLRDNKMTESHEL